METKDKMLVVNIVSLNQEEPNTCGSCIHTDNTLGIVTLRCQIIYDEASVEWETNKNAMEECDFAKVRSWHECHFEPSRYLTSKQKDILKTEDV